MGELGGKRLYQWPLSNNRRFFDATAEANTSTTFKPHYRLSSAWIHESQQPSSSKTLLQPPWFFPQTTFYCHALLKEAFHPMPSRGRGDSHHCGPLRRRAGRIYGLPWEAIVEVDIAAILDAADCGGWGAAERAMANRSSRENNKKAGAVRDERWWADSCRW